MRYKTVIAALPQEIDVLEGQLQSLGLAYMNDGQEQREIHCNVEIHFHAEGDREALAKAAGIMEHLGRSKGAGINGWDASHQRWGGWISPKEHS